MGEISGGGDSPQKDIAKDHAVTGEPGKIKTDADGVFADGEKNGMPVFDVSREEFNQNMNYGRKRLRFKSGTSAAEYMRATKYNKKFFIRNKDDNFVRIVK